MVSSLLEACPGVRTGRYAGLFGHGQFVILLHHDHQAVSHLIITPTLASEYASSVQFSDVIIERASRKNRYRELQLPRITVFHPNDSLNSRHSLFTIFHASRSPTTRNFVSSADLS